VTFIPDALWKEIEPLIPPPAKVRKVGGGKPRVSNRSAMNAIFFVLRTGCQWNALKDTGLCSSSSAHRRFQEWTATGVFNEIWKMGLQKYDSIKTIDWDWQSIDGAITKAPLGGEKTGHNPTDRAKQGVKRSIITDGAGIPLGIAVNGANCHDITLARDTIQSIPIKRPRPRKNKQQGMCLDKGYRGENTRLLLQEFGYTIHLQTRKEEAQALKREVGYKARQWVVERTHSWMNRFRGILIRWSKKLDNYLALLHLTLAYITYAQTGLLG